MIAQISGERTRRARRPIAGRSPARCSPSTRRPILAAALLWMIYDLVVYASILFGPSPDRRKPRTVASITFNLVMYLGFTLPASMFCSRSS